MTECTHKVEASTSVYANTVRARGSQVVRNTWDLVSFGNMNPQIQPIVKELNGRKVTEK